MKARMSFAANGSRRKIEATPGGAGNTAEGLTTPSESHSGGGLMPIILPHGEAAQPNAENDPPSDRPQVTR